MNAYMNKLVSLIFIRLLDKSVSDTHQNLNDHYFPILQFAFQSVMFTSCEDFSIIEEIFITVLKQR